MPDEREHPRSIPISALEHHAYCPRQAALIHLDGYFTANVDTVLGDLAHTAVDRDGPGRGRDHTSQFRSLPVWSDALRIHGICDVVQFRPDGPIPIEHKVGTYHPGGPADVQVAAQVLCLREMFNAAVPIGIVFTGKDRRRHDVQVDSALADRVHTTIAAMRAVLDQGLLPEGVRDSRCRRCSLREGCMPDAPRQIARLFTPRTEGTWRD